MATFIPQNILPKKTTPFPRGYLFEIAIFAGSIATAFLLSVFLGAPTLEMGTMLLSVLVVWAACSSLGFFLFRPSLFALIIYALSTLPFIVVFAFQWWALAGSFAFLFFVMWGYYMAIREQEALVSFNFFRIMRRGLSHFFSGLAILLAFLYNFSPAGFGAQLPTISQEVVEGTFIPINLLLESVVPGYRQGMTVGQFQGVAVQSLIGTLLPQEARTQINPNELLESQSFRAPEAYGKVLNQTLPEFVHSYLNTVMRSTLEPYQPLLPMFYILGLFFVFRMVAIPLIWETLALGWVFMRALMKMGIIKLEKELVERERPVLA